VALVTFILFFMFVPPKVMAVRHLSAKAPKPEDIHNWLEKHGYDKPLFLNFERPETLILKNGREVTGKILEVSGGRIYIRTGSAIIESSPLDLVGRREKVAWQETRFRPWDSQFFRHLRAVLTFNLGRSDQTGERISAKLLRHMGPSLMLTVPAFIISLFLNTAFSLYVAYCRGTYVDRGALVICVLLMAVPMLIYIIAGQWVFSLLLRLCPISGWEPGVYGFRFLLLPISLAVLSGLGGSVRFYRTVMLEEIGRDYVRTARAKGMGEARILFRDVLKNAMIPILTSAVLSIPFLFLGNLLVENFFGIPGLGSLMISAIDGSDFSTIRALVSLGTLLYILGLLLTDLSYTLVNPRIRFEGTPLNRMILPVIVSAALVMAAGGLARLAMMLKVWLETSQARIQSPWVYENIAVVIILGLAGWLLAKAWKRAYWREAFRRVTQNRLAIPALAVVLLYGAIAVLDSVSWKVRPGDLRPKTLLDRLFQKEKERTYSAPLAETEYRERRAQGLAHGPHILGTDSAGEDVFYMTLKGVRTALIIGMFTTLIIIPLATFMGIVAGYFRGWIDDTVQLLYTMLASIPEILLLVSLMIVLGRGLPQLCFALGITSWVGLCRMIRGETLKLRELDFVQGSKALGARAAGLLWLHILPNVMHLIVITFVLRFSGLVMTEVVLSYLRIGVASGTGSWGVMIDGARLELARDPVVWWNLVGAFGAMFLLVLSFNYFGDVLRDALDPRLRER